MASRRMTIGIIALAAAAAASSGGFAPGGPRLRGTAAPGTAQLRAFGGRSPAQRTSATAAKFDGTLADLARHTALVSSSRPLSDLHSLSPAAHFKLAADGSTPLVAIDAVTRGDPQQLRTALQALGLEKAAVYSNDVGGWLPVSRLQDASALSSLSSLRAALSRTRSGAVATQGDFVQGSAAVRTASGLTGSGVTVGVLSDSFDCYAVYAAAGSGVPASGYAGYAFNGFTATAADDVASGALPTGVSVLEEADCLNYGAPLLPPFGDEGRAMLQIVHAVAPGASLAFYTAETSEADFAAGIGKLAAAGAKVIADDVEYFDEPFYQDGLVAQAIDAAETQGVAYFTAAGNDGNNSVASAKDGSYETTAPSFATLAATGANSGEYLLNFDTTAATTSTSLPIFIDAMMPGQFAAVVVQWDQPYFTGAPNSGGATSSIDVCVTGSTGAYTIQDVDGHDVTCTGPNAVGSGPGAPSDPVQILIIANPANATANTPAETLNLQIGLAAGTVAPGRVIVAVQTDGQAAPPITRFATNSATLQGHAGAAGAGTVGAAFYFDTPACGTTPAVIESYSSQGGAPILFSSAGARLAAPAVRQKPDFVGPDGVNDTFLGFTLASQGSGGGSPDTSTAACRNDPAYPNFFGTSAATPHVAGIATLLLQANSAATPAQIYAALRSSALAMSGGAPHPPTTYNFISGYGFVQASGALASIPPGAPTLSAAATTVLPGASTAITWSSVNATACTASGAWSGTLATGGTQTVTPGAVGTATYSLTCANAAGASPVSSVSVTAAAAPSGGGGGGSMDGAALAALLGLCLAVRVRVHLHRL